MTFIYFVDLTDFVLCNNISKGKGLQSVGVTHYSTFKNTHPLYSTGPDLLLTDLNAVELGFMSPRLARIILIANWYKNGLKVGEGVPPYQTRFYPESYLKEKYRIAQLEVAFEKKRRLINPDLPSRLACLFLAENNDDGRLMLQNMFYNKRNFIIVEVDIQYIMRIHKADSKWVDLYLKHNDESYIENYWNRIPSDNPNYEYLLDGSMVLVKQEDIDYISNNIPTINNPPLLD